MATGIFAQVQKGNPAARFGVAARGRPPSVGRIPMPLPPVLFEDDALVAYDKPAGLPLTPDRRDKACENLLDLVRAKRGGGIALVHRIDAEGSGVVLFAKTKPALDFLSGQFQSKTVGKTYEALTVGVPVMDLFTVDFVLKEDEAQPGKMCVVKKHGHASVTEFTVREKFPQPAGRPGFTYVECRPLTGRMHQVRVHLAASGTPVLRDPLYGDETQLMLSDLKRGYKGRADENPLITRLALHASGLAFTHPLTREPAAITARLPNDFSVALKYLRKFAAGTARRPA